VDIRTPAEAIRALTILLPGFEKDLARGEYKLVTRRPKSKTAFGVLVTSLHFPMGRAKELHLIPKAKAAGIEVAIIAGFALVAAAVAVGLTMAPPITADANQREVEETNSFIFDGPVNVSEQGHPLYLTYGTVEIGSIVGAASLEAGDMIGSTLPSFYGGLGSGSTGGLTGNLVWSVLNKGGKGGGSTRSAQEDPNTLQSESTARIFDILGEGECEGPALPGLQWLRLNGVPLENADGSFNYHGVDVQTILGLPTQEHIRGQNGVAVTQIVGTDVTIAGGAVTQTITDPDTTRCTVTLEIPALWKQNTENGDLERTSVAIKIELQSAGGGFTTIYNGANANDRANFSNQKNVAPYQRDFPIDLPAGGAPWIIRMSRITADGTAASISNDTIWKFITPIIDAKLTYPYTAGVGLTVSARQFGTKIPKRSYLWKGIKVLIPSNYNPLTRVYTGQWNGTFIRAWTDNPAWVYYDMCTNSRYGLGNVLTNRVDKWGLYDVARHCDELVDDGYGGQEPRFTCNVVITKRSAAYKVLNALASSFRAMTFWNTRTLSVVQDVPADPWKLVGPTNTGDGKISYSSKPRSGDYSAWVVTWNDPTEGYKQNFEIIEAPDLIRQFGWKAKEVAAFACTSRGQAHRFGRWLKDDQLYERKQMRTTVGADHADCGPGRVIKVSDPTFTGKATTGRVKSVTSTTVTLDRPVDFISGAQMKLSVVLPDGEVHERIFTGNASDVTAAITFPSSLRPIVDAMWILESDQVVARQFRVTKLSEIDDNDFNLEGTIYDPNKWARVEQGIDLTPDNYVGIPSGPISPPAMIGLREFLRPTGNSVTPAVRVSWSPSTDARAADYEAQVKVPGGESWTPMIGVDFLSRDIDNIDEGSYSFRVRTVDALNTHGPWRLLEDQTLVGPTAPLSDVTGLISVRDDEALQTSLRWAVPIDVRPFRYRIYRHTSNVFAAASFIGETGQSEYVVTEAAFYWVQVAFMDERSPTPPSVQVSIAELPAPVWDRVMDRPQTLSELDAAAAASLNAVQNNITNLFTIYGSTTSAADSAAAALVAAGISETARDASLVAEDNIADAEGRIAVAETTVNNISALVAVNLTASQLASGNAITAEANATTAQSLAENARDAAVSAQVLATASETIIAEIVREQYDGSFQNGNDYWVAGYTSTQSGTQNNSTIQDYYNEVTLMNAPGKGQVLQALGAYRIMSDRMVRPFIDNQEIEITLNTRLTLDSVTTHRHYIWLIGHSAAGINLGFVIVASFNNLVASDGWVNKFIKFTPDAYRVGALANATSWRVMISFNSGGSSDATQQISSVNIQDTTQTTLSEIAALASFNSSVLASASETATTQNAAATAQDLLAAQTARAGAELAETNASTSETNTLASAAQVATNLTLTTQARTDAQNFATASLGHSNTAQSFANQSGSNAAATSSDLIAVAAIKVDTTAERVLAQTAASASSASSISAAASETSISQTAGIVQQDRIDAQTARAGAELAESNSAASETTVLSSAAQVAADRILTAASETAAAGSATASEGSASSAGSFASDAQVAAVATASNSLIATTAASEAAANANMKGVTPNGGFDSGDFTGWKNAHNHSGQAIQPSQAVLEPVFQGVSNVLVSAPGSQRSYGGVDVPIDTARKYKLRVRYYHDGSSGNLYVGYYMNNVDGVNLTWRYTVLNIRDVTPGWYESERIITGEGSSSFQWETGTKFAHPMLLVNWNATTGTQIAIDYLYFEDVTAVELAAASATASLVSAAAAAVSETIAGQQAVISASERQLAQTARAGAELAESNSVSAASTSTSAQADVVSRQAQIVTLHSETAADAIATAADVVTTSGHVSQTSADVSATATSVLSAELASSNAAADRLASETAAAASVVSAASALASETASSQSASASNQHRIDADIARGSAVVAQNAAAIAQNNAEGFSIAASTSSLLSANSQQITEQIKNSTGGYTFEDGLARWQGLRGTPATNPPNGVFSAVVVDNKSVLQFTVLTPWATCVASQTLPITTSTQARYRFKARMVGVVTPGAAGYFSTTTARLDDDGLVISESSDYHPAGLTTIWQEYEYPAFLTVSTGTQLQFRIYCRPDTTGSGTVQIKDVEVADETNLEIIKAQALIATSAAASSSSDAATTATHVSQTSGFVADAASQAALALGSANTASAQATLSQGEATSASASAASAASSQILTSEIYLDTLKINLDPFMTNCDLLWHHSGSATVTQSKRTRPGSTGGYVLSHSGGAGVAFAEEFIPVDTSKQYRMTFRARQNSTNGARATYVGFQCFDQDRQHITGNTGTYTYPITAGQNIPNDFGAAIESILTGENNSSNLSFRVGTKFIRRIAYLNHPNGTGDAEIDVFDFREVSSELAAANSANITIANAVQTTADVASTSAFRNETSAFRNQALGFRDTASGYASSASSSASLASAQASLASTSATLSATHESAAHAAVGASLPEQVLGSNSKYWTYSSGTYAPGQGLEPDLTGYTTWDAVGDDVYANNYTWLLSKGVERVAPNRVWELEADIETLDKDDRFYFIIYGRNNAGAVLPSTFVNHVSPIQSVADGKLTQKFAFTNDPSMTAAVTVRNNNVIYTPFRDMVADNWELFRVSGLANFTNRDGSNRMRVSRFSIRDITSEMQSGAQYQSSLTQANIASAQAVIATDAAAASQSTYELSARISNGSNYLTNPSYAGWNDNAPRPVGWALYYSSGEVAHSTTSRMLTDSPSGGNTVRQVTTTLSSYYGIYALSYSSQSGGAGSVTDNGIVPDAKFNRYVVVGSWVKLISGSFTGAGLFVNWRTTTGSFSTRTVNFNTLGLETGKWHWISKVLDMNSDGAAISSGILYLMSNYNSFGGYTPKDILWGPSLLRPATDEEILSNTAIPDLQASVVVTQGAIATAANDIEGLEAYAGAVYGVQVNANGHASGFSIRNATTGNITTSEFLLDVDKMRHSASGETIWYSDSDGITMYQALRFVHVDPTTNLPSTMMVHGNGFGANNDLMFWAGNYSATIDGCTTTNGFEAKTVTLELFQFGQAADPGSLEQDSAASISVAVPVTVGVNVDSNGNDIQVTYSYSYNRDRSEVTINSSPSWTPTVNPTATLILEKRKTTNGTVGAWETVSTKNIVGTHTDGTEFLGDLGGGVGGIGP